MKVYFENSRGVWRLIGSGTKQDCSKAVYDFLQEKKFKSYYTQVTEVEPGVERWDVGSHSEFFYLIDPEIAGDKYRIEK